MYVSILNLFVESVPQPVQYIPLQCKGLSVF